MATFLQHRSSQPLITFIAIFCGLITISTLVCATPQHHHTTTVSAPTGRILEFREANFSTWNQKVRYNSSVANNPKGMEPLYRLTKQILDVFLGEKPIPDGK